MSSKISFHAANVGKTRPALEALVARSGVASEKAVALSRRVRELDDRRNRLAAAIQATSDVLSLRSCVSGVADAIAVDDLERATEFVGRFRRIEAAAEAGGEAYDNELAQMRESTARVEEVARARYFEACVARDDEALERWLPLVKRLGLVDAACGQAFLEHFRHLLRGAVRDVVADAECAEKPLLALQKVINAVAGVVTRRLTHGAVALESERCGPKGLLLAHDACEAAALAVVAKFAAESGVAALAAEARRDDRWPAAESARPVGLDDLDGLLEDVATALQRLETWRRFAAHYARATLGEPDVLETLEKNRLADAAAELGGWYATLENRLCLVALRTAERLDATADVAVSLRSGDASSDAPVSTAADDGFWAARRSAARALGSGHAGAALEVLAFVAEHLGSVTQHGLSTRAFDACGRAEALLRAELGFGGLLEASTADETVEALRAGLERRAEEVAAKTLGLAARAQGALEGAEVVAANNSALGASSPEDRARDLDMALLEAQVALNTLDLAASTHLPRFRLHVDDEVAASYGSDASKPEVAALLGAAAALGDGPGATLPSVGAKFADALEAARGALVSSALARDVEAAVADAAGLNARARFAVGAGGAPHRYAADEQLFEALDAVDDFGDRVGRAAAAAAARATAALGPANKTRVAGLLAEVAADALLDDLQDKAAAARVTALGALQLDRDVRALRGALAAAFAPGDARPDAALNAAVREGLGVASHAATLLGLEDPKEAADVVSKFVMPEDLPPILALRWGDASP